MKTVYEVATVETAHQAVNELYKHFVKPQILDGARGRLIWEPLNTTYRHQLRKLFHGSVLEAFSMNVRVLDAESGRMVRYLPPVWKRHLTDLFCPAQFADDGAELVKSTEKLSDEEFSDFILACEAYGATEHDIEFPERGGADATPNRI